MYIDTRVVRALMAVRRIDEATLANIANVSAPILTQWLYDDTDASEELIAFDTQLEILRVLGINGETPRNDIVHYWYVHEDFFSSSAKNYWALSLLTGAFGKADAVYFAKEADPLVSIRSKAHFGLQFPSFKAVLEVTSHPLRNIGFDPDRIGNLQWAPGNFGVLVDQAEFEKIAPGLMTPSLFDSQLNVGKEMLAWERLNLIARDRNIGADRIEQLLLTVQEDLRTPKLAARRPDPAPASDATPREPGSPVPESTATLKATVRTQAAAPRAASAPAAASVQAPSPVAEATPGSAQANDGDAVDGTAPALRRPQARARHASISGARRPWAVPGAPAGGTTRDE